MTVPDVVGMTKAEAIETLESVGVYVKVEYVASSSVAVGHVVNQSKKGLLVSGSIITIYVCDSNSVYGD